MWFNIKWNNFGGEMLPIKWRDIATIEFVKVLLKPINQVYYSWYNWRNDNLYKMQHTGQICSLRGALNDRFDQTERRIYITDGNRFNREYLYITAEERPRYMGTMYLHKNDDFADTGVDFIVWVPSQIIDLQYYELKALIEFYKQGGKRYKIESI